MNSGTSRPKIRAWPPKGITANAISAGTSGSSQLMSSPVDFPEHDVDRSDHRDDVGDEVSPDQPGQCLQIAEGRRSHTHPIRSVRSAVADDEEAELAFRGLDRVIGLAGG